MKRHLIGHRWLTSLLALGSLTPALLQGATPAEEESAQLAVLLADRSPREKDAACFRLKPVATARAATVLGALLQDEQLYHSALYVLEPMREPEAGQALLRAFGATTGARKAAVAESLGLRRQTDAVPALTSALGDSDPQVAAAAADALGKIGGAEALRALSEALPKAVGPVRGALADGLLAAADRWVDVEPPSALAYYRQLDAGDAPEALRLAAYRGVIRASVEQRLTRVVEALLSDNGPRQAAALPWVRELPGAEATRAFAGLLPRTQGALRIALVEQLAQRGNSAAAAAVAELAGGQDPALRLAAVVALGELGDATVVGRLTELAARGGGLEQKAARQALLRLRDPKAGQALAAQLEAGSAAIQTETVKALAGRGDRSVLPRLLELAKSDAESTRKACCQGLALLGGEAQVGPLVRLVENASGEAVREDVREALQRVLHRLHAQGANAGLDPLLQGLGASSPATRVALLPLCASLPEPRVRALLRAGVSDPEPNVRAAAVRALCESVDAELLPDMLRVAREDRDPSCRILALRGGVRLARDEEAKLSNRQRIDTLRTLLEAAGGAAERRLVLAGLAQPPELEALDLVLPFLDAPATQAEASQAAARIAGAIWGAQPEKAKAALQRVLAGAPTPEARQLAEATLRQIASLADYLTQWQVAGPYRREGKDYAALFDLAFPPETNGTAGVDWRPLPAGGDPTRVYVIDLLKALGGEQAVAYARTRIHSEKEQTAALELGSDDGIKVWLNGRLIHANNTARPITPGSDKARANLRAGWNELLLKVTQNNQGWAFSARLTKPDGSPLGTVRSESP